MRALPALLLALTGVAPAHTDELPPPEKKIEEVIDQCIDVKLKQSNITPAPLADVAIFLRRVTLDVAGRIPTAAEVQAYLASTAPDKKVQAVERLLASPSYVRHQATELDVMLSTRPGELRGYLLQAVAENRSWDRIFRELLLPSEDDPKKKGSTSFLRQRVNDLDRLTNEVSVLFFGVNVSCAQCHDHPKVDDWKQDHFYGMKAFFARTYDASGVVGEREFGLVKFKPNKGAEKQAKMMFLTGKTVEHPSYREPTNEERKTDQMRVEEAKRKRQPPPAPAFSARAQLVETALLPGERDYFARSLVNRLWHRYFGLGLVSPVDQMHSANEPSHPELLAWLARDTISHGYDLKRLTRGIVLSKAYARSSRWEGDNPPRANLFAVARVRPLGPMQLALSLRLATTDPQSFGANLKPEDLEKRIEGQENSARGLASQIEQPRDDFQISVGEALLFSNSDRVQKELLADSGDRLLGRLKQLNTPEEIVDTAVRNVFCRPPCSEEVQLLSAFLQKRAYRPVEAARQMVWALLTGSEFRFNH
jgi:hypothetical protein